MYLRRFRENVGKGGSTRGAATVKVVADPARKVSAKYSRLLLFLWYILKLFIASSLYMFVNGLMSVSITRILTLENTVQNGRVPCH